METLIVRIMGTPVRVPRDHFTEASPNEGEFCETTEPCWPDGSGGGVVCTLPPHESGPDGTAHMANNADAVEASIIAIWWDTPAVINGDDFGW